MTDSTTAPVSALQQWRAMTQRIHTKQVCVFFDYDGTLTPIVAMPDMATLAPNMVTSLDRLASLVPVGVISGRELADIRAKIGLDNIFYGGNHGFEIWDPHTKRVVLEKAVEILPELDGAYRQLRDRLAAIDGVTVEHKKFSLSVHFRLADERDIPAVEDVVDDIVASSSRLSKHAGKMVLEIRPSIEWHKGFAVNYIVALMAAASKNTTAAQSIEYLPIYIGDDVTDEDAFRALKGHGISILVGDASRVTAADYLLDDPEEVVQFVTQLIDELESVHA